MTLGSEPTGDDHSGFRFKIDTKNMPKSEAKKPVAVSSSERVVQPSVPGELYDPHLERDEDLADVDRVMRDLRYANLLDSARDMGNLLSPIEQQQITNSLERRRWGGILRNLEREDTVISILSATSDLLSIKNLNDNVFGPQTTDIIIAKRRQLTETIFNRALSLAGVDTADLEHASLEQNYKFGVFKIPGKYKIDAVAIANQACAEVDREMKKFIIRLADEEESKFPNKRASFQNFRLAVNSEGYKMTFGAAKVESDGLEDIILAVNGSLQTARATTFDNSKDYGEAFSPEKMIAKIDQINELRNKIFQSGNRITGIDGVIYEIYGENSGIFELNRDLLREVRKDKFRPQTGHEEIWNDLKAYVKGLNIFDVVKPFTADEVGKIKDETDSIDTITSGVRRKDAQNCRQAVETLDRNEKDERFTSEARFHAEAVKIKNCAYLSLDVLDVGIDQLLDFEQRVQAVGNKDMSFAQASLEAGDLMTKKLRLMRGQAYEICKRFGITQNERMNGLVGGDELTLAIDLDVVDEDGRKIFDDGDKKLNKLILQLRRETNSRVVKTVIAESRRNSTSADMIERTKEHLKALKNAEEGTNQAKQVENALRQLDKFIKSHPDNESAIALAGSLKDFVMTEVDDHFTVRTELGPDMSLKEALEKIASLQT
ncbi:MAG: hypothetical protein WCV83_03745 [Candidatus Magasanikbacteria bacterium]